MRLGDSLPAQNVLLTSIPRLEDPAEKIPRPGLSGKTVHDAVNRAKGVHAMGP
jgi:hypothetical protein